MQQVRAARDPLEVAGAVVVGVAIDMVDLRALKPRVRMPRHGDETMDVAVHAADLDVEIVLPAVRDAPAGFQDLARDYLAVGFEAGMRPNRAGLAPDEARVGGFVER